MCGQQQSSLGNLICLLLLYTTSILAPLIFWRRLVCIAKSFLDVCARNLQVFTSPLAFQHCRLASRTAFSRNDCLALVSGFDSSCLQCQERDTHTNIAILHSRLSDTRRQSALASSARQTKSTKVKSIEQGTHVNDTWSVQQLKLSSLKC